MKDNLPVPINNDVVFNENEKYYIKRRHKRRKKQVRKHKQLRSFLLLLVFGVLVYNIAANYKSIYTYVNNMIEKTLKNSSYDGSSSPSKDEEIPQPEKENENAPPTDSPDNDSVPSCDFIDTSPAEFQQINESKHAISFKEGDVRLPDINEIYSKYSKEAPIVLIVNFSSLEAYSSENGYSATSSFYDKKNNTAKIGAFIADKLSQNGINALHISNHCDSLTLYESKKAFKEIVNNTLKENPSIAYVIDISRGININDDLSMNNETICVNSIKYPTIQLWCGTSSTELSNEQEQGILFAQGLAEHINRNTSLLISRLTVAKYDLSLNLAVPAIRADIGTYACTLDDALISAELFTNCLVDFLNK